jgi:hypothetical protein
MHSRLFNVTKNEKNIDDLVLIEEEVQEKLNGICDYVGNADSLEDDVYSLLGKDLFPKAKKIKSDNEDVPYYFKISYSVIQKFIEERKKRKAVALRKSIDENLEDILNYLDGKKKLVSDDDYEISQKMYSLSSAIKDRYTTYIQIDGDFLSLDDAMIFHFESMKKGECLYIFQSFDYHF